MVTQKQKQFIKGISRSLSVPSKARARLRPKPFRKKQRVVYVTRKTAPTQAQQIRAAPTKIVSVFETPLEKINRLVLHNSEQGGDYVERIVSNASGEGLSNAMNFRENRANRMEMRSQIDVKISEFTITKALRLAELEQANIVS